jgi:hypothetical protein
MMAVAYVTLSCVTIRPVVSHVATWHIKVPTERTQRAVSKRNRAVFVLNYREGVWGNECIDPRIRELRTRWR